MDSMLDYIKWRGDIPLSRSNINEADIYLICKIGSMDFSGIVSNQNDVISFRSAVERYFMKYGEGGANKVALSGPFFLDSIKSAAYSERFGSIGLSGFVNIIDKVKTEQFSAMTLTLTDDMHFVTFRGTDDNILAWKENFYLSCQDTVSAQDDAVAYLRYHSTLFDGPITLAGHSKGGNLAIFAACNSSPELRDRIESVYSFDGPGFHSDFYSTPEYHELRDRIYKILPRNSLVGTLLDNPDDGVIVVNSDTFGIDGHSGFTWETSPTGFVRCGGLSRSSRVFDTSIDKVLSEMDIDSRRDFIDALFKILDERGATTVSDLMEGKGSMLSLGLDLFKNPETKAFFASVFSQLAKDYVAETQKGIREDNRAHRRARDEMRRFRASREIKGRGAEEKPQDDSHAVADMRRSEPVTKE